MTKQLTGLVLLIVFWASTAAAEVHLSVAKSMTNAARDLMASYQAYRPDVAFRANFASSGSLAKQIVQGAPADLYISANPRWMDYAVNQGLIETGQVKTFAHNALVVVGRSAQSLSSLAEVAALSKVALASPRSAPAGQYARQALQAAGVWDVLNGRRVLTKDVRLALAYADRGEVDAAFVYQTDALLAPKVRILLVVPPSLYDRVTYPAALTKQGSDSKEAQDFFAYLATDSARQILIRHGFVVE